MRVVPAVIPTSAEHLKEVLTPLYGVAPDVQIDLVDLHFGDPSWPYREGSFNELLGSITDAAAAFEVEADLMVEKPDDIIPDLISAGVKRLVVHPVKGQWPSTTSFREAVQIGLAFYNDMALEALVPLLPTIDFVQCMGIAQVGAQGRGFDERVLKHIAILHEHFPELPISVDGSVNTFTLPLLKHAGATRFVSGSAILGAPDPRKAYEEIQRMADA